MTEKASNYREDFPGYQGHIPYKYQIIGQTVGSTNDTVKHLLTAEPQKETLLQEKECSDFSQYNRDYFCDQFPRDYPWEEDKIFSNKSKDAESWIDGDKYKIYPQHIPGVKCHVPGIYSSNIYGMGYSKSTSVSIKGNYNKKPDCSSNERYKSSNMVTYEKPQTKPKEEERLLSISRTFFNPLDSKSFIQSHSDYKRDLRKIYKSKIAQVPTPGYAGHTSIFNKHISYLNYNKILENEKKEDEIPKLLGDDLPDRYRESLNIVKSDNELPYVVGYKGFRVGVRARNYHGENFQSSSLEARNEAKLMQPK